MNVNVKLSLTDEQRNRMKCHLVGKSVKAMVTRAEVNELVRDLLAPYLDAPHYGKVHRDQPSVADVAPDREPVMGNLFADDYTPDEPAEFAHDECCRANDLLRSRLNQLQHRLDTMK